MKNKKLIVILLIILLALIAVFSRNHWYGGIYHNKLSVDFRVHGIRHDLDGTKVEFSSNDLKIAEKNFKGVAQDWFDEDDWINYVNFVRGMYGNNKFRFSIKAAQTGLPYDIVINLGKFNDNNWYKNSYEILIYVNPNDDMSADVIVEQRVYYYDKSMRHQQMYSKERKLVNKDDNEIK
ncbi:MAG: hypothetical protein ACI4DP_09385 [Candidatus Ornithomonoglobus sp.]